MGKAMFLFLFVLAVFLLLMGIVQGKQPSAPKPARPAQHTRYTPPAGAEIQERSVSLPAQTHAAQPAAETAQEEESAVQEAVSPSPCDYARAEDKYRQGAACFNDGDMDCARKYFFETLALCPDHFDAQTGIEMANNILPSDEF